MKAIGNVGAVLVGLFLMGVVMVAQRDYQNSFGGSDTGRQSVAEDSGSIASYSGGYETIVMK